MKAFLRILKRLRRRRRINIKIWSKYFKFYIGEECKKFKIETNAAQFVESVEPWRSTPKVIGRSYLYMGFFSLSGADEFDGLIANRDDCLRIAEIIANAIPSDLRAGGWRSVFDRRIVRMIEKSDYEIISMVDSVLSEVEFPVTGAHGDLSKNNVLVSRSHDSYTIIDWETFREDGSCIEDIIRLIFTSVRSKGDPYRDINELVDSNVLHLDFLQRFLTYYQALVVSIVSQATAEIESRNTEDVYNRLKIRIMNIKKLG